MHSELNMKQIQTCKLVLFSDHLHNFFVIDAKEKLSSSVSLQTQVNLRFTCDSQNIHT